MMDITTSCTLDCPDMCSIRCTVHGARIRLAGDPDHPLTRGLICGKIRRYPGRLTADGRITQPQLRSGDGFRTASWDEAFDVVCQALGRAVDRDPQRVLLVRSAGSMGWSKEFVGYVFSSLGARATRGSLCSAVVDQALATDAGAYRQNDLRELARAQAVVLWGKNPLASSIHTASLVADARHNGAPVVAVTPDPASVRTVADSAISLRPGSDRFLALAVSKLLLERADREAPWDLASDPQAYRDLLARSPVVELLAACDVPLEQATLLADLYASTSSVATVLGWGLGRYDRGGENVRAVHALTFLAGTLQQPAAGLFGGTDTARFLKAPTPPRSAPGPAIGQFGIEASAGAAATDVAWITCSNLVAQAPDGNAIRRTLAAIPTVVVVDGFWTDTALCADVVLPSTLWLEEEDVVSSYSHAGIGFVRRVAEAPTQCRNDFQIAGELARRLGLKTPYATLDDWLAACLPGGQTQLDELRRASWLLCDETPVVWQHGFAHPDGRFRLLDHLTPEEPAGPDFPLYLLSLVRADALNSQRWGATEEGPLPVRLNPATAALCSLAEGDAVRVESPAGAVAGAVVLDPHLHPEAVVCPRGGWHAHGAAINDVTAPRLTDIGETAAFYSTRVRVVPA